MEKWKESVTHMSKTKLDNEFGINGVEKNSFVLSQMIKNSKSNIVIYTQKITEEIFNKEILTSLIKFLDNGGELKILFDEFSSEESSIIKLLNNYKKIYKERINFIPASGVFISELKLLFKERQTYHFSISDNCSFKLEINEKESKSICNFNDKYLSKKLLNTIY